MAMVKNVQQIHAVLWDVIHLVSGTQYIGMGVAMEIAAMRETVNGNPKLTGHLHEVSNALKYKSKRLTS